MRLFWTQSKVEHVSENCASFGVLATFGGKARHALGRMTHIFEWDNFEEGEGVYTCISLHGTEPGPVLVTICRPPPLKKSIFHILVQFRFQFRPVSSFVSVMFWNEWKINFPLFAISSFWDMVDFQSSRYTLKDDFFYNPKRWAMFWNGFLCGFWAMVDFVLNIRSELGWCKPDT